jgi:hypothetical protein
MGDRREEDADPSKVIRNDNKAFVITALSHMHLLSGFVHPA